MFCFVVFCVFCCLLLLLLLLLIIIIKNDMGNLTRDNIHNCDLNHLLICFCSFDLSCLILEKDNILKICILDCLDFLYRILFEPCLFQSSFTCFRSSQYLPCFTWEINIFVSEREREMFYLTTHSTHFINGYMASDIWLRTILIVRKETRCRHIGYSYQLKARVLLYAPSHRQEFCVSVTRNYLRHYLQCTCDYVNYTLMILILKIRKPNLSQICQLKGQVKTSQIIVWIKFIGSENKQIIIVIHQLKTHIIVRRKQCFYGGVGGGGVIVHLILQMSFLTKGVSLRLKMKTFVGSYGQ